jgi:hypothetical protein
MATAFGARDKAWKKSDKHSHIVFSDWVDSLIGPSGKVSSLINFIEVEDVLLEGNEKLIFDRGFLLKQKINDLPFAFELQLHR